LSATFLLLFFASVLAFVTNAAQGMGRSLLMDSMGFDTSAITSTVAVSGLITLPFPFLLGLLSDRVSRKPLLIFCYLISTLSLIILATSHVLWHFCHKRRKNLSWSASFVDPFNNTPRFTSIPLGVGLAAFVVGIGGLNATIRRWEAGRSRRDERDTPSGVEHRCGLRVGTGAQRMAKVLIVVR
jgi:MFS family permease